ncbi:MAG: iron chelate uptake ABC transporter family permease subunit, partial [Balneolales bacterium]
MTGLTVLLCWLVLVSVGMGAVSISTGKVFSILLDSLGLSNSETFTAIQQSVLIKIRLPRVLLAVLVGAALAVSGAAMQGLFRNPLADPGLIGVSSGAALATAIAMVVLNQLNFAFLELIGAALIPLAAFTGGILATVFVYRLSTFGGKTNVATMLLTGIAVNAMAGAVIGYMIFLSDDDQLRDLTFWTLGSLSGAMWPSVFMVLPFLLITIIFLPRLSNGLNAILL